MRTFFNVQDIGSLDAALKEALEVKQNRFGYQQLGKNKTLLMIFFNNSLRTRLSTQKAAMNLGMNVIVLDVNAGAWKLETERGVIMDGDKSEHLLEAIPVMGCYCDIIAVRSFAGLKDRDYDYAETIVNQFVKYSGRPVVAMETATVHPLQAFADLITIHEKWSELQSNPATKRSYDRPKVVMTWAPHCRALPQAVPNSFAQWMNEADVDFVISQPEGYELDPKFTKGATIEYDQHKALEGADFVYAKNWSCPGVKDPADYGKILSKDMSWTIDETHMSWTNDGYFMHCLPVRRGLIVTDDVIVSSSPRLPTGRSLPRWYSRGSWRVCSLEVAEVCIGFAIMYFLHYANGQPLHHVFTKGNQQVWQHKRAGLRQDQKAQATCCQDHWLQSGFR